MFNRFLNRDNVIIAVLLLLSIVFTFFTGKNIVSTQKETVTVQALNEHNAESNSSEVWLTGIKYNDKNQNMEELFKSFDEDWILKDGAIVFVGDTPSTVQIKVPGNAKVELDFTKHAWSGKVLIEDKNGSKVVDLYSADSSEFQQQINTDYYKIKAIALLSCLLWIFTFLYAIRTKLNYLVSRLKYSLGLMVAILVGFRILYWLMYSQNYSLFNDSDGYIKFVFDGLRTPLYSLTLSVFRMLSPDSYLLYTVLFQSVLGILSVLVLYAALKKILNHQLAYCFCTFYGILPVLVNYESCILTESLSLSLLIIVISLLILYLDEERLWKALCIDAIAFLLAMIRPSHLIVGIVLVPFWLIRSFDKKKNKAANRAGLSGIALYGLLLLVYSYYSYIKIGVMGISNAGELNVLITLIMSGLYHCSGYDKMVAVIDASLLKSGDAWVAYQNVLKYVNGNYPLLKEYLDACVKQNLSGYISYNINYFLQVMGRQIAELYAYFKGPLLPILNQLFFPFPFVLLLLAMAMEFLNSLIVWIKDRKILWMKLGLSSMGLAYLVSGILGAPIEAPRHSIYAIPIFIIMLSIDFNMVVNYFNKSAIKETESERRSHQ